MKSLRLAALVIVVGIMAAAAACSSSGTSAVGGSNPAPAILGHSGRFITDSSGRIMTFHGFNMVAKIAPYYPASVGFGDDDAAFLQQSGFNAVRVGVIYAAVEPTPGIYDDNYLSQIEATVNTLAKHGIYSLLDFHQDQYNEAFGGEGFPSWAVEDNSLPVTKYVFPLGLTLSPALNATYDNFWNDSPGPGGVGLQERYAAAWKHVAARFADNGYVLGYDLFNEPWPGTLAAQCISNTGCPVFDAKLGGLETKAIQAIRSVDKKHIVFYEPNVLFNFGTPTRLPKFNDPNVGMDFHDYCLSTSAGNMNACALTAQKVLDNATSRTNQTGDALLVSEYGAADDPGVTNLFTADFDADSISWLEWAYCGCGDPTGTIPPSSEALVFDPTKPPVGTNVNQAILASLARPYPRSISGSQIAYSYSLSTKVFTLTYSTTRADHSSFQPGSVTEISAPAVQYPSGYAVSVNGGKVTSPANAAVVDIASDPGAATIAVTIKPSS